MRAESAPLPRDFLRPCLLLLLREQSAHGYELLQRLQPLGFVRDDPGGLYRALRGLERDGLVRSAWQSSRLGPARRIYELTRSGTEELHRRAKGFAQMQQTLELFLSRYGEFVSLAPDAQPARR